MNMFLQDGKIWISIDTDDAENLRDALTEFTIGFVGSEKFPWIDKLTTMLENGIEQTLGLPIFPKRKP